MLSGNGKDHPKIAEMLIQKYVEFGIDLNVRIGGFKETPLHFAIMGGQLEVYKLIMDEVTDKNPKDYYGDTPLHVSAM